MDEQRRMLWIVDALTQDFYEGRFDVSRRAGAPRPGWEAMPEVAAVSRLRSGGATPAFSRMFLTLVGVLDRARNSDRLWRAALELAERRAWLFDPREIGVRSEAMVRTCLREAGLNLRHGEDAGAWLRIAEALLPGRAPREIRQFVLDGVGDAVEIRRALRARSADGTPWYPLLRGAKISVVWIRAMAAPGEARVGGVETLPVGVDTHVVRATVRLGVLRQREASCGREREAVQAAWRMGAAAARGPAPLRGTCAALDPALWFFGKWGCSVCGKQRRPLPMGRACAECRWEGVSA